MSFLTISANVGTLYEYSLIKCSLKLGKFLSKIFYYMYRYLVLGILNRNFIVMFDAFKVLIRR